MNRALQMACVEAETSARLSRKFIANISHELRTPLNSVVAFNSLLLEADDLNSIHREYVSSSLTSAEALLGIINQVLEYAKLEAKADGSDDGSQSSKHEMIPSSIDFTEKPFHLGELSDELSDIMAARLGTCPFLLGDSFRLRQCLINLCDNAVKFCRDEGGQVILSVRLQEEAPADSAFVCLEVWDNGEGIPLEQQDLLFKPFSQLPSKHMSNNGGTGLGLAITKRIVSAMCGTIECVSNTDGRGTTFRIVVPLPVCSGRDFELTFPKFMARDSLR
ncbi:hypothetical protein GUITHDRAFT_77158 [Guillardia theta CCMP2712]|uniref:histidine kinase n=1 Tax=Guillardia theta (strain CCMP2712) TaxID=905079 RepID=L1IQU2_GUITC|nr:hypothetical protein GUITHDRAFT_77158 [Guillardia theta CCMP2712]EKX38447.1 hypothetical protein GUITHDRAFT_77158 [Guillardia theta CCMP2712]|eukprot:XP_005825427.1 hypothetical protein GUITHDRAFT_77158 [Guillardia theta CCMP2712]